MNGSAARDGDAACSQIILRNPVIIIIIIIIAIIMHLHNANDTYDNHMYSSLRYFASIEITVEP